MNIKQTLKVHEEKAAIIYKSCVPNMNNFWYHLFELPEIQLSDAIS